MATFLSSLRLATTLTAATNWDIQEGIVGSNACPSGYHKLADPNECRAAMSIKDSATTSNGDNDGPYSNMEFQANWFPEDLEDLVEADFPAGCYYIPDCDATDIPGDDCLAGFYFNKHPTGQARQGIKPLCKNGSDPIVETGKTLFVGDSDADFWKDAIVTFSPAYNIGVGGFTCDLVRPQIDGWLAYFQPSTVVLVCGENDLAESKTPEQAYSYHKETVDKIIASGARVIEMGTKPEPDTTAYHAAYRAYDCLKGNYASSLAVQVAKGELTCCSKVPGTTAPLTLIDSYASLIAVGNGNDLYHQDNLHLSKMGYDLWDSWLANALEGKTCVLWTSGACTTEAANATSEGTSCAADSMASRGVALLSPVVFVASFMAWALQGVA